MSKVYTDSDNLVKLGSLFGYDVTNGEIDLAVARGLNVDYKWDLEGEPKADDPVDENGEGTYTYNKLHSSTYPLSMIGKISALTLEPLDSCYGNTPYTDEEFAKDDFYFKKYTTFSDLCKIRTEDSVLSQRRDLEYYPEDFLYCKQFGYTLNKMITLRRFPFPTIDNIMDPLVQREQDIGRLVTFFDNDTNSLSDILTFSYGMNWKELESEFEAMRMEGDQEGLSGFMKKVALVGGDQELIKNRLRGPNGNRVAPDDDQNKAHGPVDCIKKTHIRDIGLNFEQEFSLVFDYVAKSYGGRNPDAVMKDIIANILMCTFNDGDFWGGARYWLGEKPSKVTNMFRFTSSDNFDEIVNSGYNTLRTIAQEKFGSVESAIETLKDIIKGGVQMALANVLNKVGRAGVMYGNSLLSGSPVGMWHLTIGHPLNPIMTIGNLICTNVEISVPDVKLTYGDFVSAIRATITLKPAMPKDRAGIEMMFNYGKRRLYMPVSVPIELKNKSVKTPFRSYLGYIDKFLDGTFEYTINGTKKIVDYVTDAYPAIQKSIETNSKWVLDKTKGLANDGKVWVVGGVEKIAKATGLGDGKTSSVTESSKDIQANSGSPMDSKSEKSFMDNVKENGLITATMDAIGESTSFETKSGKRVNIIQDAVDLNLGGIKDVRSSDKKITQTSVYTSEILSGK